MSDRSERSPCRILILEYLERQDYPVSPHKIAGDLRIKPSSGRARLTEMLQQGLIHRPYRGYYQLSNPTRVVGALFRELRGVGGRYVGVGSHERAHGVGVHNVVIGMDMPEGWGESREDVEEVGGLRLRFIYGLKRRRITVKLGCGDEVLDWRNWPLLIRFIQLKVAQVTGWTPGEDDMLVKCFELHEDYDSLRMEGVKCLTVRSFTGALERIYNRGRGLRSEVSAPPTSVESIYNLLKGGVTPYNMVQVQMMQQRRIGELTREVNKAVYLLTRIAGYMEALIKRELP